MPLYEYQCQDCDLRFEKLILSIEREPAEIPCPDCGSSEVRRLISRVAVSSGQGADPAGEAPETPAKPPVFGRKELNEALKKKGG
ncbi:MAG: zinc ribbon domain-containing protein [Anaerolineae bacterium]|jgi:putative FmdB family regulatory protein